MKLSHLTAFAIATVIGTGSIGAPAQAGILKDIAGTVSSKIQNRGSSGGGGLVTGAGSNYLKVLNCSNYLMTSPGHGPNTPQERAKATAYCKKLHS